MARLLGTPISRSAPFAARAAIRRRHASGWRPGRLLRRRHIDIHSSVKAGVRTFMRVLLPGSPQAVADGRSV